MSAMKSFAEKYKTHAFHDLIEEAENQGIAIGVQRERERIIKLLKDRIGWIEALEYDYFADELAELIKGE